MKHSHRVLHLIALLCVGAVALALLSQHVFDMPPCAWCVLQRLVFLGIALVCWLAIATSRMSRHATVAGLVLAIAGGIGGLAAGWYQHTVAAEMFSCDRTFADRFMVDTGLDAGIPWLFGIFASCMDARVKLLGVEYVFWSMALFVIIIALRAGPEGKASAIRSSGNTKAAFVLSRECRKRPGSRTTITSRQSRPSQDVGGAADFQPVAADCKATARVSLEAGSARGIEAGATEVHKPIGDGPLGLFSTEQLR